jgi:hypothetical protein
VGPTLLALKSLLELPTSKEERFGQTVNGLLSACLLNIEEMRCVFSHWITGTTMMSFRHRQGLIPLKKIRNNLLAAVLALTVIPSSVKIGQVVLEQFCTMTSQKLLGIGEVRSTSQVQNS